MGAVNERSMSGGSAGIGATLREGGPALLGIVAIALLARVIRLNSGYWIDELYALMNSYRLPFSGIVSTFWGDAHHPLYSLFARMSLTVFGEAPWATRAPAVVFGTAAVAATYLVARLVASRREALLASLILAVSYHHVWFSQNARGYTLMGLLALASTVALVRMLERGSWQMAVLYAVIAALGAYTHLTMVFVAFGQAIVAALTVALPEKGRSRMDWRVPVTAFALAGILSFLLYLPMLGPVLDFFINRPSGLRGTSTPSWALAEAIRVLLLGVGTPGALLAGVILVTGSIVAFAGFASVVRLNRTVGLAFALPPVVVLLGALAGRGTMYPRFFFFAASFAVIVAVRGLFACGEFVQRRWPGVPGATLATTGAALVAVLSTASLSLNYRYPKQDFVGAMRYVQAAKAPEDTVAFAGVPGDPYPGVYGRDWPTVNTAAEINALRQHGRTWLIYTFPRYLEVGAPEVSSIVKRECHERAVFRGTVGGGDMIICTLDPA